MRKLGETMGNHREKSRIWFWIVIVVLSSFIAAGGFAFYQGWQVDRQLRQYEVAELARLDVDLSKPGTFHGPFHSEYVNSHGLALDIVSEPAFTKDEACLEAIKGLKVDVSLTDAQGETVYSDSLNDENIRLWGTETSFVPRLYIGSDRNGQYKLAVTVKEPASGLAGRKQTLVGKYMFCGLEYFPVIVSRGIAIGAWIVAGIIGIVMMVKRRKRPAAAQV